MSDATPSIVVGIFVGGRSRRMGGRPKGLARLPDGTSVVERLARVARGAFPDGEIVLVGDAAPYQHLEQPAIVDDPAGLGPIGGLCALLAHAARRDRLAISLACDLPRLDAALLRRLVVPAGAAAIAPKPDGIWQPLVAGYRPAPALRAARSALDRGERALFAVLDGLGDRARVVELTPSERVALDDWDTPDSVARDGGRI